VEVTRRAAKRHDSRLSTILSPKPHAGTTEDSVLVKEGDPAPDFDLEADDGTRVSLATLTGRNVVLFFYPKDNTSG
jgi:cytochrome oxidase Cu insertion factor (SCO1/SenC/PrrC family)